MEKIERRSRSIPAEEFRLETTDQGGRTLVGYASVFNSLSETIPPGFRERVLPGAFAESLKTADVRALVDHEPSLILGRTKPKTLRLLEDEKGLRAEIDLPATSVADDLVESLRRGDIDGMSFGFRVRDQRWIRDGEESIRELVAVDVFDVSVVTYPCYLDSSVALRSFNLWRAQDRPLLDMAARRVRLALADCE